MPLSPRPARPRRARSLHHRLASAVVVGVVGASLLGLAGPEAVADPVQEPTAATTTTSAAWQREAIRPAMRGDARATLPLRPGSVDGDGERVLALQQRLQWAGEQHVDVDGSLDSSTAAAVRSVQAKADLPQTGSADAATVAALSRMTRRGPALDRRCLVDGPVICVDKTQKVLRYLVSGAIVKTLDANFGPEKGEPGYGTYSRTREGSFHVYRRSADHVSSGYGTPMKWALFFDGAEAMHYSRYFRDGAYAIRSFGCVDIGDFAGARWVFNHSPNGTPFIVYH